MRHLVSTYAVAGYLTAVSAANSGKCLTLKSTPYYSLTPGAYWSQSNSSHYKET